MLGVQLSPVGNFTQHLSILKTKMDAYAVSLRSPKLSHSDVKVFHRAIYTPAVRYSLPAVASDTKSLQMLQSKVIPTLLQRLGFTSKLPKAIRHGPEALGGLELMDISTESEIERIKFFRHAIYSQSEVGKLLLINVQTSQLESGISFPLLEQPKIQIPYLTPTWTTSLRDFLALHNISITLTDQIQSPSNTASDSFIMNLPALSRYTIQQQRDINLVRQHLQVVTLSDMCDPSDRRKISDHQMNGRRPVVFQEKLYYPRQPVVTAQQQRLWRKYIASVYLRYDRYWRHPPDPGDTHAPDVNPTALIQSPTTQMDTIKDFIRQLPRPQRRLLAYHRQLVPDVAVWREFRSKRRILIASDGGLKGRFGTFGWTISSKGICLIRGRGTR